MKKQTASSPKMSRNTSHFVSVVGHPKPTLTVHQGNQLICEASLDPGQIKKLLRELVKVI